MIFSKISTKHDPRDSSEGNMAKASYPGMLPRIFRLEIAYLASACNPEALKKISDTTFTKH